MGGRARRDPRVLRVRGRRARRLAVVFDETLPPGGEIAARVAADRDRLTGLVAETFLARVPERSRTRARAEVEALSHAILGAAEALARWWLRTGSLSAAEVADLLVDTVVPGLQARTRAPRQTPAPSGDQHQ